MDTFKSWAGLIGIAMLCGLYIPLLIILMIGFGLQELYDRFKSAKR